MVLSLLKFTAAPDKRQAIIEILRTVERRIRGKLGCLECEIYERGGKEATAILYLEKWKSKEDLHRHIQSDAYVLLLTAMEFGKQEPEIYFHEIPEEGRMEVIKNLRS